MAKLFVSRDPFELFNKDQDLKKKHCAVLINDSKELPTMEGHFGLWEDHLARQQKMTEFLLIRRCQ